MRRFSLAWNSPDYGLCISEMEVVEFVKEQDVIQALRLERESEEAIEDIIEGGNWEVREIK